MSRFLSVVLVAILCLWTSTSEAHVGSPNVILEGKAGNYPVRIVIRPPDVIPGVAEITIKVESGNPSKVTVRPVFSDIGKKGSPAPDEAKRIHDQPPQFNAGLWFMKMGTYSVDVEIDGDRGHGSLSVPVNASATNTRPMTKPYAAVLVALGLFLFFGALAIIRSAWGQSLVPPGAAPTLRDRRRGLIAVSVGTVFLSASLFGGKYWWNLDEMDYKNNRLYKQVPVTATIQSSPDQLLLEIHIDAKGNRTRWAPLIPDHGKLMHLFLVRKGAPNIFAHLHPAAKKDNFFSVPLPPLMEGAYDFFGDITHENGFAETLTGSVEIPPPPARITRLYTIDESDPNCSPIWYEQKNMNGLVPPDPDDSTTSSFSFDSAGSSAQVGRYLKIVWLNPGNYKKDEQVTLKFQMQDKNNKPVELQNYMGMEGHAIFRKIENDVFAHVHPLGTFSMASQQLFTQKEKTISTKESPAINTTNSVGNSNDMDDHVKSDGFSEVSFPYAFPRAGRYQFWVQMKTSGRIYTGTFHTEIQP
ncbi:MAG: hypothetical protein JWM04_220 [Verrucomicrobiales bacterium]|nr:hypothetical protein [Verrucomicrobiales bacterium]